MTLRCALVTATSLAALQLISMSLFGHVSAAEQSLVASVRVTGRVLDADRGRPVPDATVTLSGLPTIEGSRVADLEHVSRRIDSDGDGRFDFSDLLPGWYSINVEPPPGFEPPQRHREALLEDGDTLNHTFRLPRAGAIEGRVRSDDGRALMGVEVQAVRRHEFGGDVVLSAGHSTVTNDLGEFRLFGLFPGEHYVVVRTHRRRPFGPSPTLGYPDTYYPGVPTLDRARPVVVRAGNDTKGVHFVLSERRLARVLVRPVDADGVALPDAATVTLIKHGQPYLSASPQLSRQPDGTYLFSGVAPGRYDVVIWRGPLPDGALVTVSIGQTDQTLNVQTNDGATVAGRVIVDGRPLGTAGGPQTAWLSTQALPGDYGTPANSKTIQVQGLDRFRLSGLRGSLVLSAGLSSGQLLSIRRAGEEIAGKPLQLVGTETIDDLVVEFTTQEANLDVSVTGTSPADEPEPVVVLLFPEESSKWHPGYVRSATTIAFQPPPVRAGEPRQSGIVAQNTRQMRVPPGRYLVVAIADPGIINPSAPGVLARARSLAVPVTLVAGDNRSVTLGVTRIGG